MPEDASPAPRQTLAMRMAEQSRLRAERAERLARLVPARAGRSAAASAPAEPPPASGDRDAAAALEEFLRSLTQGLGGGLPPLAPAAPPEAMAPAEVLPFQRPPAAEGTGTGEGRAGPCDLDRLEGAGPGLVWALRRAGIRDLAGLAALEPAALAARLGPIGRLVPAEAWIAAARGVPGA